MKLHEDLHPIGTAKLSEDEKRLLLEVMSGARAAMKAQRSDETLDLVLEMALMIAFTMGHKHKQAVYIWGVPTTKPTA